MALSDLGESLVELAGEHPILGPRVRAAADVLSARRRAAALEGARDAVRELGSCTEGELGTELGVPLERARELIAELAERGIVESLPGPAGRRWHYQPPMTDWVNGKRSRRAPPEKDPPAYAEARATGMPVRVAAMTRLTRQGRSTSGVQMFHRQRDRNYERMQATIEARKSKVPKEPKWKRRK